MDDEPRDYDFPEQPPPGWHVWHWLWWEWVIIACVVVIALVASGEADRRLFAIEVFIYEKILGMHVP